MPETSWRVVVVTPGHVFPALLLGSARLSIALPVQPCRLDLSHVICLAKSIKSASGLAYWWVLQPLYPLTHRPASHFLGADLVRFWSHSAVATEPLNWLICGSTKGRPMGNMKGVANANDIDLWPNCLFSLLKVPICMYQITTSDIKHSQQFV